MQDKTILMLLAKYLSEKKILHSFGVAETARELSVDLGQDPQKAYLAGLLHDIARELPPQEILTMLRQNHFEFCQEDLEIPAILHGYASALIVEEQLNIIDKEILQAISRHTTGDKDMTILDAIIFVADMIEPNRDYKGVQEIRTMAKKDIFAALLIGLKHSITYLLSNNDIIHPRTLHTYNWLLHKT